MTNMIVGFAQPVLGSLDPEHVCARRRDGNLRMASTCGNTFVCNIYAHRPHACRVYPWQHAQVLFATCVYIDGATLISHEEAVSRLGGEDEVTNACKQCGKCCYGWSKTSGELRPVVRCVHLRNVGERTESQASMDIDHERMHAVEETWPLG